MSERPQHALIPQPSPEPPQRDLIPPGAASQTNIYPAAPSLPILVRMRSVSIEIYQDPRAVGHDDVIVIDMTPSTYAMSQAGIPAATRGVTTVMAQMGMNSYRAGRNAPAAGGMVNLYI